MSTRMDKVQTFRRLHFLAVALLGFSAGTVRAQTVALATDKARYAPGERVRFSLVSGGLPAGARVRYGHLASVLHDRPLAARAWTWLPPRTDYRGYWAELYLPADKDAPRRTLGAIALDVSSDWRRFPRYGFVATFDDSKTDACVQQEMAWLNRCHINGVQFQDWHYSHHRPCPPFNREHGQDVPFAYFQDVALRWNCTAVIRNYIARQHAYGMKAIFYNLAFGALPDAAERGSRTDAVRGRLADGKIYDYPGVSEDWYLLRGDEHGPYQPLQRDRHALPRGWKSDIYLVNPGHTDWINYLNLRNEDVYRHFAFDGFQIDQLGDRGWLFEKNGAHCYLPDKYAEFIEGMHRQRPQKELIMNSVSRYGSQQILRTGKVSFAYNETWGDARNDGFDDLYDIIQENRAWGGPGMQTVFAAYMNYNKQDGTFNTPGVLLTDAVIFALGAAHLELGDHMLCHEYFPFRNVAMTDALKSAMERYYDFSVAYENLLRDPGREECLPVAMADLAEARVGAFKPEKGKIVRYGRQVGARHVLHFLNFTQADSTSWRDIDGTMPEPDTRTNLPVTITCPGRITKAWCATPDVHPGLPVRLALARKGDRLTVTLPSLKYWTMLVLE